MEMAMEVRDEMGMQVERLSAAAAALEQLLDRGMSLTATAGPRELELEQKLIEAEATIASLRASAATSATVSARKTVAPAMVSLMAKYGIDGEEIDMRSLDAALISLSIEQRIAVKSGMLRSGIVS